jgi:hypothetical protein
MKKLFAALMVVSLGLLANISAVKADAEPEQVVYSNRCCDATGVRCLMGSMYPLGTTCICYGIPGSGWVC